MPRPIPANAYPIEMPATERGYAIHNASFTSYNGAYTQPTSYYYPPHTRIISAIENDGERIHLDDGTSWEIQESHTYEVRNYWKEGQPIVVSPSSWSGWGGSRYYITNLSRGGSWVYGDVKIGPTVGGSFTNRIVDIDYVYGRVTLLDGRGNQTTWEIDPMDKYSLNRWRINQAVFLGTTDNPLGSWGSSYFDIHLLNIEQNQGVCGRRF